MTINLTDSINRLDWASELITYLEDRISKYLTASPLSLKLVSMDQGEPTKQQKDIQEFMRRHFRINLQEMKSIRLNIDTPTPATINLALGDVVENIRICYEYLAQSIAKEYGFDEKELDAVYFPSTNKVKDIDNRINAIFKGKTPQEINEKIKNLEPYMGGKYRIREIAALSNLNKHREPISVINIAKKITITSNSQRITIAELEAGMILGSNYLDVYSSPNLTPEDIIFSQPEPDLSIALHKIKEDNNEEGNENILQYLNKSVELAREVVDSFKQ
ncbi:hypothetical protein [Klebsiella pneumoniae]|uniref:hypothetical protein n=1 Tax=Klebsiella pneumoniae TaxID=573 RepID=UPI000E2D7B9F|nr:hypothetical protein [Klebsiella pneumoniae]MDD1897383.1 hypothetical protein [Klebsiella pneumoniae]SXA09965.1 Uncharacterised protein [Klebsiella pneumoniae]